MGPLDGLKIVEIGGIGPGPFAAMMLADMGADVLRIVRPGRTSLLGGSGPEPLMRGRVTATVDLKDPVGLRFVRRAAEAADALLEGMRPGVMERLKLGPDDLLTKNPRLVYGRMTGFGQAGPLADTPGHDINYISIAGALGPMARVGERPLFPLNLVGDYGGGGMLLAFGIVCGILEARHSGRGQVVDAAMVDGAALLTALFHGLRADGRWSDQAGTNVLDSGAHFYEVYGCADGGHVAVGAIEASFYAALLVMLEIEATEMPQWDRERWPEFKRRLEQRFVRRTRSEWAELAVLHPNACVTPVLGLAEAPRHPHNMHRQVFIETDGVVQPAPAPRFSRTKVSVSARGQETRLRSWGFSDAELRQITIR